MIWYKPAWPLQVMKAIRSTYLDHWAEPEQKSIRLTNVLMGLLHYAHTHTSCLVFRTLSTSSESLRQNWKDDFGDHRTYFSSPVPNTTTLNKCLSVFTIIHLINQCTACVAKQILLGTQLLPGTQFTILAN